MQRDLLALELDKVLALLANEATCADAQDAARALRPVNDLSTARRQLDDTVAAAGLLAQFGGPSFGQIHNVDNALRRAEAGASLSPRELLAVAEVLRVIRSLKEWRQRCAGVETCLDDRFFALSPNKFLENQITTALVSEEEVADAASPALADIRRKMRAAAARVRERLENLIRSSAGQKWLQDPVVTIRGGRFVVPVKAEHRGQVPGLVHDTSASGATVFVEPMAVVEANNEVRLFESKEQEEIDRILAALSAQVGEAAGAIADDYHLLVELNLIFAKARLSYTMKAVPPMLTDDGVIRLRRARHPLLDHKTAVPIDVELGGDNDTLVITGPNTGGKTVTLKTIGLLTLMAMCGLMPPVGDGSTLSVFDRVLADIGDEQSIEQSLSTFSAHMTNQIRILDTADDRSLVLLDELGAGTDPVEGAALAMAILERLRAYGARVAATTHYAELKAYALHTPGVINGSCEFDVATLRPTYRLLIGVPGRSNAFAISERLGMDPALVDRARALVPDDSRRMEDTVTALETQRQQLERELAAAKEERRRAEDAGRKAQAHWEDSRRQRDKEAEAARAEARRIVDRARAEAEALMRELDELRRQKQSGELAQRAQAAKSALRSRLRAADAAIDPVTHKPAAPPPGPRRPLKAGDEVRLVDVGVTGVVLEAPDDSGICTVQAGIIRTRVAADSLVLLDKPAAPKTPTPPRRTAGDRVQRSAKTEVDLRGMTTDEALLELEQFLDNAILAGLPAVTVIHGKGTGALRAAVQQHLRGYPGVASFRLGAYGEGENGVTIVELA